MFGLLMKRPGPELAEALRDSDSGVEASIEKLKSRR